VIQIRALTRLEPATTIVVYFLLFQAVAGLLTAPFGWTMPNGIDALTLLAMGLVGGVAQVFVTQSYRHGEASVVAPFDYTSMIWAMAASWLVFGTWPSATVIGGAAIVVAAGLAVIHREAAARPGWAALVRQNDTGA
jgi:drug/metabolite transporter (DMT)-like permease